MPPFVQWIQDRANTLWEAADRVSGSYADPEVRAIAAEVARAYREAAALLERRGKELETAIAGAAHNTGVFDIQKGDGER